MELWNQAMKVCTQYMYKIDDGVFELKIYGEKSNYQNGIIKIIYE